MEEKKVVIEILKNPKVFIDYLQTVDDVMTADVESKKKKFSCC